MLSSITNALAAVTQELVVLGIFLLSYVLWQRLGAFEAEKRAARKLKATELNPGQGVATKPLSGPRPEVGGRGPDATARSGETTLRRTQVLEEQMAKHLQQHEFTRALNLYRGARSESCAHRFSEEFYTTFIESAVRVGKMDVVERLFGDLRRTCRPPTGEFWRRVLKMLASRKHFSTCLSVHTMFQRQLPTDKVVWSCLANAALELGDAERAGAMLEPFAKAEITVKDHNLFFRVYHALKDVDAAEATLRKLGAQASPLMLNLTLLTCVTCGQPARALRLLHASHALEAEAGSSGVDSEPLVDVVSYNTVIKGLAQEGNLTECFKCLNGMISRGLQPDDITFATLLDACIENNATGVIGEIVNVSLASANHQCGTVMHTLFIKGLVRANCLPKALELYEEMKQKMGDAKPDVITYSVLIKALVDQHELDRALQIVQDMKAAGHEPDDIILTHLLEGCRFAGDYELGKRLFADILASGVRPSEYTLVTMLKLYGRAGAHKEAHDLVSGWEATYGYKPSVIHYTCLMSGCLRRKHYDLAWSAFELMKSRGVKPDSNTFSTLLPAMVAAQNWDHTLALATEALAQPAQQKVPSEILTNALAQMQAAGSSKHTVELGLLLQAAGVPIATRRLQRGRPQPDMQRAT